MSLNNNILLEIKELKKVFPLMSGFWKSNKKEIHAVNGISFDINEGETLGLVGESGCGKSTTGKLILRLLEATSGEVYFKGVNVFKMSKKEIREKIRPEMQIIFQDPYSSLNPRKNVNDIIIEPLNIHKVNNTMYRRNKVLELLELVGLRPEYINRYPHEFSGGQRQRVGIARALALNPKFIVCDEPVSALDVSIRAQIINLLKKLQNELGLTYLFIAHDFSVVKYISNRIAVMYLGKIVEIGESEEIYTNPMHPYTKALISSIPLTDPKKAKDKVRKRIILKGDVPSSITLPEGCIFSDRCPIAEKFCKEKEPVLRNLGKNGTEHLAACFKA
jgi:oligopeptide transport system ATP-binding protein